MTAADAAFGAPPFLEHPVTDPADLLGRSGRAQFAQAAAEFRKRFQQSSVTLLLMPKPANVPARPWLFWVFNRGGLHSVMEKGGACRRFLLWIDPDSRCLAAICGYGLEPLLSAEHLRDCLQAAGDHAAAGQISRAALSFIRELDLRLTRLHLMLPRTFGWADARVWCSLDETDELDDAVTGSAHSFAY